MFNSKADKTDKMDIQTFLKSSGDNHLNICRVSQQESTFKDF